MRNAVQNLLLVIGSFLLSALVVEGIFRALDHNVPLVTRYDPHTGFTNGANISGWTKSESIERISLDEHGLRVHDETARTSLAKSADAFRIALLGDSYTESFYVSFDESFPHVLERELATCPGLKHRVEVLNFGVSGYSNVQELLAFRHKARRFAPDLVLLVVHAENDLRNNFRKHEQNLFIPYAELRDGRLVLDESFRDDPAFQAKLRWSNLRNDLVNNLWSLQFAVGAIGRWRQKTWHAERVRQMSVAPSANAASVTTPGSTPAQVLVEPRPAEIDDLFHAQTPAPPIYSNPEHFPPARSSDEVLWRLAEAVIRQIRDEVVAAGASFWLTNTATGIAISPNVEARAKFLRETGLPTTDYAKSRLARFAQAESIGYIPLAEELRDYATTSGQDLEWFPQTGIRGHWIAPAHAVVGRALAQALCDAGGVQ